MLDIDPATGALVDSNGNFVLGTSATEGKLNSPPPVRESTAPITEHRPE